MKKLSHLFSWAGEASESSENKRVLVLHSPSYLETKILQWHQLLLDDDSIESSHDEPSYNYMPEASNINHGPEEPDEWTPQVHQTEKALQAMGAAMPDF